MCRIVVFVVLLVLVRFGWGADQVTLGWLDDVRFEQHDTGPGHPESPERLRLIRAVVAQSPLAAGLLRLEPREAVRADLLLVHSATYLDLLESEIAAGRRVLSTGDAMISPGSLTAAKLAVGGILVACDTVLDGKARRAFCAVRPPGHHAERDHAMGFCFFNNVAIGARHLQRRHGVERVAIIERNILRLGIHELMAGLLPAKVVIDESLWLAHRFAGPKAPPFINGVLDRVARDLGRL